MLILGSCKVCVDSYSFVVKTWSLFLGTHQAQQLAKKVNCSNKMANVDRRTPLPQFQATSAEQDRISLFSQPLTTMSLFLAISVRSAVSGVRFFLLHPVVKFFLFPITLAAVAGYQLDGPHKATLDIIYFWLSYVVWWVGLGVLSSIGLGSGIHSGILFLFPHVIKVSCFFCVRTYVFMCMGSKSLKCVVTPLAHANENRFFTAVTTLVAWRTKSRLWIYFRATDCWCLVVVAALGVVLHSSGVH